MTPALDLAAAFHARFLVMLESYSDDSLSGPIAEQPNRICVVAGWFGDGAAWRDLERNWQGTIRREGLHEFKASDCHGGYGEFKNWGEDRCLAFRRELVGLLVSSSRIVGAATIMTFDPDHPKRGTVDYRICLLVTMTHLASFARVFPEGERVAFIVDERAKGNGAGDLEKTRTDILRLHRDTLRGRIGPAGYDRSDEVVGLQAADLLAHECLLQRVAELDGRENRREFLRLAPLLLCYKSLHGSKDGDEHNLISLDDLFPPHTTS